MRFRGEIFWGLLFLSLSYCDIMEVMAISNAGMAVQQQKLTVIAENIANINTVKTVGGAIYTHKDVVIKADKNNKPFANVEETRETVVRVYDPTNPDADETGYVLLPEHSLSKELVNVASTRRYYDANAAVFNSAKSMAQTIMNLGK